MEEFKLVDGKLVKELPDGIRIELLPLGDGGLMVKAYDQGTLVCRREMTLHDLVGDRRVR